MKLVSINPYTEKIIREYDELTVEQIKDALEKSKKAFAYWRTVNVDERTELLSRAAKILIKHKDNYAKLITSEMGKPIKESRAEIEKCAWVCTYYAENASEQLAENVILSDADESWVRYEPLGPILGVMPWNFPFWQVFRFVAPTLAVGNSVLLKHASNVQGCAFAIEEVFKEAGFPENILINLAVSSKKVKNIVESDVIKAVTLTGSELAGSQVSSTAGGKIKKTVLELGGSNSFIVFNDADIDLAVKTAIIARFQNGGQSCIAAKRFFLQEGISEVFLKKLHKEIRKLKIGNPMLEETDIGPLANLSQANEVEQQINESIRMGAKALLNGGRRHNFICPTLLIDIRPDMPVFKEEVFGPVVSVMNFNSEEEVIYLSNCSSFGLGVSLFTSNLKRAKKLIGMFDDGGVFINSLVKSDPRLPFGGTKKSGYGRELSVYGIHEFVNIKTVYIKNR